MGKWAMYRRRGSAPANAQAELPVPPPPSLDFHSGDHSDGGFDIASQSVPADTGGSFALYVQTLGVGHFDLADTALIADGNPFFIGEGLLPTSNVYVTEQANGVDYQGESNPSNIETI